jgi:hypothetical protein
VTAQLKLPEFPSVEVAGTPRVKLPVAPDCGVTSSVKAAGSPSPAVKATVTSVEPPGEIDAAETATDPVVAAPAVPIATSAATPMRGLTQSILWLMRRNGDEKLTGSPRKTGADTSC